MPTNKMYEGRAVVFDFNDYLDGCENPIAKINFILAANVECHNFLPPDWYIQGYDGDKRTIVVGLERYKRLLNLQPLWKFKLIADPVEDDGTQWIVFDVVRWQPDKFYSFQLP